MPDSISSHPAFLQLPDNWLLKDLDEIACLAPVQRIRLSVFEEKQLDVRIKRDDLLDPLLGGNKIYKLHGHLQQAINRPEVPLVTFGGAFSNHIHALAAACHQLKLRSVGIIRGEQPQRFSPTLQDAKRFGMQLLFISREDYRAKSQEEFTHFLQQKIGPHHLIKEGGAGEEGVKGCMALARGILNSVDAKPDVIVHACGTGTSLAGIVCGVALSPASKVHALGISVLKGPDTLTQQVNEYIEAIAPGADNWSVNNSFHCGGYAKYPAYLADFVRDFETQTQVILDPVYTSKVMWGLVNLAERDAFPRSTHIIVVHSGGLQGRRGMGLSP